jgi:hypothetical protein
MSHIFNTFYFRHVPISPTLPQLPFSLEDTNSAKKFLFYSYARLWENSKIYYTVLICFNHRPCIINLLQRKDCVNIEFVNTNYKYRKILFMPIFFCRMILNDTLTKQKFKTMVRVPIISSYSYLKSAACFATPRCFNM